MCKNVTREIFWENNPQREPNSDEHFELDAWADYIRSLEYRGDTICTDHVGEPTFA